MDIFTGVRHQLKHDKPLVGQVVMPHRHQVKPDSQTTLGFKDIFSCSVTTKHKRKSGSIYSRS